jgi:hypothetical protein
MPPSKNQNLKPSNGYTALPDYWSEDDKINYEILVVDAKRYYPYMDDYIIHIGVIAHINKGLGKGEEPNQDEAKKLMEKYNDKSIEYITPYDADFDFKNTMLDLIKPNEPKGLNSESNEDDKISLPNIEEDDEINKTDGKCNDVP